VVLLGGIYPYPSKQLTFFLCPFLLTQVKAREQRAAFTHYFTQLCAIIGGVYVVVGQLHRLSSRAFEVLSGGSKRGGGLLSL
jgi:hypothetical protein